MTRSSIAGSRVNSQGYKDYDLRVGIGTHTQSSERNVSEIAQKVLDFLRLHPGEYLRKAQVARETNTTRAQVANAIADLTTIDARLSIDPDDETFLYYLTDEDYQGPFIWD